MDVVYKVSNTFAQIHRDPNPMIFVMGPVGSGKSSGCIWHAVLNAMKQHPDSDGVRHYRHLVVRATYPALRSTVIKTWIEWFKDKITITYTTPILGKLRYPLADGTTVDIEINFLAVDDEQSIQKLRSLEVTSAHINEASEISKAAFEMVASRVNRFPSVRNGGPVNPFTILDYNAVSTDHWLYKLAEEDRPSGHSFYRQPPAVLRQPDGTYYVNQEAENLANLPANYYSNILLLGNEDFISVNLMNNYGEVRTGRPVYKDYDDNEHFVNDEIKPLRGVPVVIGVDQGLTPAAVFTQLTPTGEVLVFDEIVTQDCSLQEFCQDFLWPRIATKYPFIMPYFTVVCDPATTQRSMNDAKSGVDILKECGLPVKLAKTNVAVERRESVIFFLRQKKKFKLAKDCKILRKGFISEYKYDETRTVNGILYKEKPAKNEYSHPHDALQYAMMEYVHKPRRRKAPPRKQYNVVSSIGGY